MTGITPIFTNSQRIQAIELSENNFNNFPWEYFDNTKFHELEFVNVNFNPNMVIPE